MASTKAETLRVFVKFLEKVKEENPAAEPACHEALDRALEALNAPPGEVTDFHFFGRLNFYKGWVIGRTGNRVPPTSPRSWRRPMLARKPSWFAKPSACWSDPKLLALSDRAYRALDRLWAFSSDKRLSGCVPQSFAPQLGIDDETKLVLSEFWKDDGTLVGYLDFNRTAEEIEAHAENLRKNGILGGRPRKKTKPSAGLGTKPTRRADCQDSGIQDSGDRRQEESSSSASPPRACTAVLALNVTARASKGRLRRDRTRLRGPRQGVQ